MAGRRRLLGWSSVLHLYYVIGRAGREEAEAEERKEAEERR